jgi:hypothetical protein
MATKQSRAIFRAWAAKSNRGDWIDCGDRLSDAPHIVDHPSKAKFYYTRFKATLDVSLWNRLGYDVGFHVVKIEIREVE